MNLTHREGKRIWHDEKWALEIAAELSLKSLCSKSKRGVIIWNPHYLEWAGGWNAPPDTFTCQENEICRQNCGRLCVHAEQMAIINAAEARIAGSLELLHIKTVDERAVPSDKPSCLECSKLIMNNTSIKAVWLMHETGLTAYSPRQFHEQTIVNVLGKQNAILLGIGHLKLG